MDIVLKQQENKSYKRRMAVAVCTTLLIVIVLGFTISIPTVRADIDWEEFSEEFALLNPENAASCFAPTISKLMTGMFIKNMTDYFYSQDVSDTFLNIIVPGSNRGWKNIYRYHNSCSKRCCYVHMLLLFIRQCLKRSKQR